jgi:hypothetical protein
MSSAPLLAGATHYYQYDLAIGSTPQNCVDIFLLSASKSNAPVTHAVFPIDIAMDIPRGNHIVPLLDLDGPIVPVHSEELSMLPSGFNNSNYIIKVVKINSTRMDTPRIGKINKLLVMYCLFSICLLTIANSCTGSHPGHEEAVHTHYLNPSSLEGVDALLVIGAGKVEEQLLLLRFFLLEPIFQDGDSAFEDFMANSKSWVARQTGGSAGPIVYNRDS